MSQTTIEFTWTVNGVLTNATSVKLSDPTNTFGVQRLDNLATVVANDTVIPNISTGSYRYTFTDPAVALLYRYYVEVVYAGETYNLERNISGQVSGGASGGASPIKIYNTALARIRVSAFVQSITERTKQADLCNALYESCRDRALEEFPWGFAQQYAPLALVAQADDSPAPNWAGRWAFAYSFPADAVVIQQLTWGGTVSTPTTLAYEDYPSRSILRSSPAPFELIDDSDGNKLVLTSVQDAIAVYTVRLTDVARFSASFTSAVAWLLACEIASAMSLSETIRAAAERAYESAISRAAANDANHRQDAPEPDSPFIRARA